MVDNVNFLIDRVNKGDQPFFPLYSPAEVDADPSLRAAGLFFIPGETNAPLAVVMAGGHSIRFHRFTRHLRPWHHERS